MADHPRLAEQFSLLLPVFSGSVSTASPGLSRGAGKLSAPRRRGHCRRGAGGRNPAPGSGCPLPSHPSSESLEGGRWGLGAHLSLFPYPPVQPRFSPPLIIHRSLAQVPRRALGARRPGAQCAPGQGVPRGWGACRGCR